jgi:hypothetical protein
MPADEHRTKVSILTAAYRITGYINLLPGARLTDFLIEAKDFIAVTEAEVWDAGNRRLHSTAFLNVNRDQIQVVFPAS